MSRVATLFAPSGYKHADRTIIEGVVNGCGAGGWLRFLVPETFYGLDISEACNIHDWMYVHGETVQDKESADRTFLNNLLRLVEAAGGPGWLKWLRRRRARIYYEAVHLFGGPAFWNGKNNDDDTVVVQVDQWPDPNEA